MARILKAVTRKSRYPWSKWADGRARAVELGKDFFCTVSGFRASLYAYARYHALDVVVAQHGDRVEFQFSKK